jgi:hypothetical protein
VENGFPLKVEDFCFALITFAGLAIARGVGFAWPGEVAARWLRVPLVRQRL